MTVKINSGKPVVVLDRLQQREKTENQKENMSPKGAGKDQVKISDFAREASQIRETDTIQDSQRAEKVALLKQQVADGTYKPDPEKVATSLLQHILKDR